MLRVAAFLFLILCEHPTLKARAEFSDELHAVKTVRQNYGPTEETIDRNTTTRQKIWFSFCIYPYYQSR